MRLISNGWAKRDDIMATYYVRDTKNAKCVGCGLCVKDCPLNIISMDNKLPIINTDKCLGCGLCVRRCPTKAAILKNRTDKIPYESFSKLHSTAIKRVIATEKH